MELDDVMLETCGDGLFNSFGFSWYCGWYAVVSRYLTFKHLKTNIKSLLTNCVSLSVNRSLRMQNGMTQWPRMMFARCKCNVLDIGTARVTLKYQPFVTHRY